jgi:hypothetical protein
MKAIIFDVDNVIIFSEERKLEIIRKIFFINTIYYILNESKIYYHFDLTEK